MPILELVIPRPCRCFAPVRVVQQNGIGTNTRLENSWIKSAVMVVAERDIFSDEPVARYYEEVVKLVRIIAARVAVMPEPLQDYLNAGISIAGKLAPSIWVSGLRTMADDGQAGSTHHFGRSSGTLPGLRSDAQSGVPTEWIQQVRWGERWDLNHRINY